MTENQYFHELEDENSTQSSPLTYTFKKFENTFEITTQKASSWDVDLAVQSPYHYFGSEVGLFSKFTNLKKRLDDHMHHNNYHNERMKDEDEGLSLRSVEMRNSSKLRTDAGWKKKGYLISILAVAFSIQFASALEIVYITPYFVKLDLKDWLDATFWMLPVIFTTLLTRPISLIAKHTKHYKNIQLAMMAISVIGCFLFAYVDELTLNFGVSSEKRKVLMTWLGLIAFCFIDVTNEMTLLIQNGIAEEDEEVEEFISKKASIASSIGTFFGYFCGSLQALQISFYEVLERNMDFCFFLAGVFMFISLVMSFYFYPTRRPIPAPKNLEYTPVLPIPRKIKSISFKMKLIALSHFFASTNILMLSVYATSWISQDVLRGDPEGRLSSVSSKLFELGVSWGAFALMLTSVIVILTDFAVQCMADKPKKFMLKGFYLMSQLLASFGLLSCVLVNDFSQVFIILPLTGLAFQTFQAIPEILADLLEKQEKKSINGDYKQLISYNFFYAQVLAFLVLPLIFLMFPEKDDNLLGMLIAGSSGLLSAVIGAFI